mmetsp:Transcript_548/g.1738  ORF Transcript_548/g.1738 Transcript_548/m.1738 type:complete len:94 (-) Transcript_548:83-364(-)
MFVGVGRPGRGGDCLFGLIYAHDAYTVRRCIRCTRRRTATSDRKETRVGARAFALRGNARAPDDRSFALRGNERRRRVFPLRRRRPSRRSFTY